MWRRATGRVPGPVPSHCLPPRPGSGSNRTAGPPRCGGRAPCSGPRPPAESVRSMRPGRPWSATNGGRPCASPSWSPTSGWLQPLEAQERLTLPHPGVDERRCLYGEAFPMTRSDRTFPVGPRLLALGAAIAALLVSVPMAGASTPAPTKNQVQSAHAAYLRAEEQIRQYRSEIESVQVELNAAVEKIDRLQAELEQIQAQIAETKARIADAQARYERIRS